MNENPIQPTEPNQKSESRDKLRREMNTPTELDKAIEHWGQRLKEVEVHPLGLHWTNTISASDLRLFVDAAKRSRELEQQLTIRNNECDAICKKLVTAENANIQLKMDIQHIRIQHEEEFKEVVKERDEFKELADDYFNQLAKMNHKLSLLHIEYKQVRERLLNVLEHCALDPDKQPPEQYLVAKKVVREFRSAAMKGEKE